MKDHQKKASCPALVKVWPRSVIADPPRLGVITEAFDSGVCRIFILPTEGGTVSVVQNAYHIGDPRLYDQLGNPNAMAKNNGCWDYFDVPFGSCRNGCEKECLTEERVAEICETVCETICKKNQKPSGK